eukprot:6718065-Prymnesium_polylepis.1
MPLDLVARRRTPRPAQPPWCRVAGGRPAQSASTPETTARCAPHAARLPPPRAPAPMPSPHDTARPDRMLHPSGRGRGL